MALVSLWHLSAFLYLKGTQDFKICSHADSIMILSLYILSTCCCAQGVPERAVLWEMFEDGAGLQPLQGT